MPDQPSGTRPHSPASQSAVPAGPSQHGNGSAVTQLTSPDVDRTLDFAGVETGGGQTLASTDSLSGGGSISRITLVPEELLKSGQGGAAGARSEQAQDLAGPHGESGKVSRLGDFVLVEKLGAGGMGVVFRARQLRRGRDVAVKVMFANVASLETVLRRFYREARLMTSLDHPNILSGYEVGEASGFHYFAMELATGGSVEDWRARLGRFSIGDSVHVILACARALHHAHCLGLIHRDVKPDNILITGRGVVKLADLGLAKAKADETALTKSNTGVGTPLYMSLEQALNAKHVDARTDIYALGCMFYYFLTGKPPFNGKGLMGVMQAKQKGTFLPARQLRPEVPQGLEPIIAKMIAKLPHERYATCADVIHDLEKLNIANAELAFFTGSPSPARPAAECVAR